MKTLLAFAAAAIVAAPVAAQESLPGTLPANLTACVPGEKIQVVGFPWAEIQCGTMGQSVNPHIHWRTAVRFNSAECQPWVIIFDVEGNAMIYCHRTLGGSQ